MQHFVKATQVNGRTIWINLDRVEAVIPLDTHTLIQFASTRSDVEVKEAAEYFIH